MNYQDALSNECAQALRTFHAWATALTLSLLLTPSASWATPTPAKSVNFPAVDPLPESAANPTKTRAALEPLYWSAYGQPKEATHDLLLALEDSPAHGLKPSRYALEELYRALENTATQSDLRRLDNLFTAALWAYSNDLIDGNTLLKAEPKPGATEVVGEPRYESDLYKQMTNALRTDELPAFLNSIRLDQPEYLQLQAAHEYYKDLDLLGGWPQLPEDTWLKPNDEDERVALLRQRLSVIDEKIPATDQPERFDDGLVAAVIRFQKRHGLSGDGEVGPATLAALNITAAEKVDRIALNLNRLRSLPAEMPEDYIRVNIPEYELNLVRNGQADLRMPVVVGSKRTPTPPMIDKMRHLVFNPYWYPPRGITVQEILPRLKREPEYLQRQRFDVLEGKKVVDASKINWNDYNWRNFPYRFRQRPGDKNSLGRVKFIFPNAQSIYLHDTPMKSLFAESMRARSHGCVRVGQPLELAKALMEWDRGWSEDDVKADLDRAKRKLRKFEERMDIYLMYLTARADETGVYFPPDIYRHDDAKTRWAQHAPELARLLGPDLLADKETLATR